MKTINETFTDYEFSKLLKKKGKDNWHDFIMTLSIKGVEMSKT